LFFFTFFILQPNRARTSQAESLETAYTIAKEESHGINDEEASLFSNYSIFRAVEEHISMVMHREARSSEWVNQTVKNITGDLV